MQLQKQIDGNLPKHHIYQLGYPCDTLLACRFPNFPIELSARNLLEHSKKERHQFKLKDMKGTIKFIGGDAGGFVSDLQDYLGTKVKFVNKKG